MMKDKGIEWYSLSRMDSQNFQLKQFNEIVADAQPFQGIDRVSLQYRKKLLIMFQEASRMMKKMTPDQLATNSQLQVKRSIVVDNLQVMQSEVESSFKEISNMKVILSEKKRLLVKLREKTKKKAKKNAQKVYVCTLCQKEEFESIQAFKEHIDRSHQETVMNRSEGFNQMNEFKDLLMTMKDKEMEMMSMFLRASREFQTQKLDQDYNKEYKKYMQISGAHTEQSKQEVQPQQLKSESQFLFFQRSQQFRRQMERDQQFRRKLKQQKSQKETLTNEFYQPNNYYNVFGSIAENTSEHIADSKRERIKTEGKEEQSYGYYDPVQFLSKFIQQHQNGPRESRCSLVDNTPKPYIELRQSKMNEKESVYAAPSISDRLKLQNNKKTAHYETMYSTKRQFYEQKGYAFNSGPLLQDKGEGSDYEDYFGKDKTLDISIQDQQIKVNQMSQNISNSQAGKESFYLSKLLSPKNLSNNSLLDKSLKEKSSQLIDFQVSDSFSKRDFQISKDDDTINLSDLKLSKLQKKKQEQKHNRYREKDRIEEKILIVQEPKDMAKKEKKESTIDLLLQYQKRPGGNTIVTSPSTNILKEFQKQIGVPLGEPNRPAKKGNKRQIDQYIKK